MMTWDIEMAATIELHFWFIDGEEGEFLLKTKDLRDFISITIYKLKKKNKEASPHANANKGGKST